MGRIFDTSSSFNSVSHPVAATPTEADFRALLHDWRVVGKDLRDAMVRLDEEAA